MSTENEWKELRSRYSSAGQYSKRQVLTRRNDLEDFSNWLIDRGAEVLLNPCQHEVLRFYLKGELGIVWLKGSGNLLAHDMGIIYDMEQNGKAPANQAVVFEYCYSCKDIQELSGDQCSLCHSYIRF